MVNIGDILDVDVRGIEMSSILVSGLHIARWTVVLLNGEGHGLEEDY